MKIDYPQGHHLQPLQRLWKEAFGDDDAFLENFFCRVFSPDRCRCVTVDDDVIAAVYWLDCRVYDKPLAYIYALATAKAHRGKKVGTALMEDTYALLKDLGYAGVLLVPEDHLVKMYEGLGYHLCTAIREFPCEAAEESLVLQQISAEEYAALRRNYLPDGSVIQEGENLQFLQTMVNFYAGEDVLFCASVTDGKCFCPELLGNADAAPAILRTLHAASGTFRTPGTEKPFAMFRPIAQMPDPNYFGFAFD